MILIRQSAVKITRQTVALSAAGMAKLFDVQGREIVRLRRQAACFQRRIFGQKSKPRRAAALRLV
ncbi:hypothetical protein AAKU55_002519 [Oxalobacteraceae bacterium GrIS 1.11]